MAKSKSQKGLSALLEDKIPKKAAKKASKKTVVQSDIEIPIMVNLDLNCIKLDPNNPRKHFDEAKMDELIESVRENGVLQPIVVRPLGDDYHYIIIAGERRYRAAAAVATGYKDRMSIPAVIRTSVTEEEARELQIVENIQRADMHPIEEAQAFLELVGNGNTSEEICAKVGKSVFYVRQRLKLNNLEPVWQEVYKAGKIRHKDALQLATVDSETQQEIFESEYDESDDDFILESWEITRRQSKLSNASFNLSENYDGLPKCTQCQFNTGVNSLFPDQEPEAYCKNRKCFELKEATAFDMNLEKVKEDPEVVLVSWKYGHEKEELESWNSAGLEVYSQNSFRELKEPDIEDYDIEDEEIGVDEVEKARYEKDLAEYHQAIAKPETVRAFMMNGSEKGKTVFGTLSKNSSPVGLPESESASDDTQAEINRIKDREKRAKELDAEKIWSKIRELMGKSATLNKLISNEPLTGSETDILKSAIQKKISYDRQHWTKKVANNGNNNHITPLFRALILDAFVSNYGSHLSKGTGNAIAYKYVKEILPDEVATIELEQKEISDKRQARVNERIATLKKKLNK